MPRLLNGAIAGFCATMAMTAVMRMLDRQLNSRDRYPLPPREIVQETIDPDERSAATIAILSHFGFGAFAGALYGLLPRKTPGLVVGPLVWVASYLGWVPVAGILAPATQHPRHRNLLMLAAHFVWGAFLARGTHELEEASRSIFSGGRIGDRERICRREHLSKPRRRLGKSRKVQL